MKEIKVGDFVRTKDGKIFKVAEVIPTIGNEIAIVKNKNGYPRRIDLKEEIYSKNILDLLQIGDLVFIEENSNFCDFIYINDEEMLEAVKEDVGTGIVKIKSILTKELYQANCYTVERNED